MKTPVEISCGAKLKGVSTRRPHSLRRQHMKKSPCVVVKYNEGHLSEVLQPNGTDATAALRVGQQINGTPSLLA